MRILFAVLPLLLIEPMMCWVDGDTPTVFPCPYEHDQTKGWYLTEQFTCRAQSYPVRFNSEYYGIRKNVGVCCKIGYRWQSYIHQFKKSLIGPTYPSPGVPRELVRRKQMFPDKGYFDEIEEFSISNKWFCIFAGASIAQFFFFASVILVFQLTKRKIILVAPEDFRAELKSHTGTGLLSKTNETEATMNPASRVDTSLSNDLQSQGSIIAA